MDAYPPDYVAHNLPLIILSGLGTGNNPSDQPDSLEFSRQKANVVKSPTGIPPITSERGEALLSEFLDSDGQNSAWNSGARNGKGGLVCTRLKPVGRDFTLPSRKADAPRPDELPSHGELHNTSIPWILHSPFSPLSPSSSLFPDGVMTPAWLAKHQHHIPAVFVSFFELASTNSEDDTRHDKQIVSEINGMKSILVEYKIRYVVVLLYDKATPQGQDVDERLTSIRRSAGLDYKNSFFSLSLEASRNELSLFVQNVLVALQTLCVEYYRDLTKHARRKKGRGSIPPPTAPPTKGTSRTLSNQGWGVRYDFKLGVFAEFRQEMDAAGRHYNIALDSLLGPDGIFETLPSWSPRWDETRMLGDIIALRLIRCLLWHHSPTSAVQSWSSYRKRVQKLLDRKGKGTSNYGWAAWESRWANIMAEIIDRADLPIFTINEPIRGPEASHSRTNALFSLPEKAFPLGERLQPWHYLHHPGYWLKLAAKHARRRRDLAEEIPDEDRALPGQSPAGKVANRYNAYDMYLVSPPHVEYSLDNMQGFDHCSDIANLLNQAISHYHARGQQRVVDQLNLELGWTLLHAKRYSDALSVLKSLCEGMEWRREGWWNLVSSAVWALNESALNCMEAETLVCTEWELQCETLPGRPNRTHDFMKCLDTISSAYHGTEKMHVSLSASDCVAPLTLQFAFSTMEGHVGEPLPAQMVLISHIRKGAKPVTPSRITVSFKGCISEIVLQHSASEPHVVDSKVHSVHLQETTIQSKENPNLSSKWIGSADLTMHSDQVKVFDFPVFFRDAGDVSVISTAVLIEAEQFTLNQTSEPEEGHKPPLWWLRTHEGIKPKQASRETGFWTHILPKPPKMDISLSNLRTQYYTDEPITLSVELLNKEDEATEAVLEIRVHGGSNDALDFSWLSADDPDISQVPSKQESDVESVDLPGHQVGKLEVGERRTGKIQINAPHVPSSYAMEIKVLYHIVSDRDTPISKILTAELFFATPFEASYEFVPRLHPAPWPSYFDTRTTTAILPTSSETATGIEQQWILSARIASFAEETLEVVDANLVIQHVHGGSFCTTSKEFDNTNLLSIAPQSMTNREFCLAIRKKTLEERRSASLELGMSITWQRPSTGVAITTTLPVPRLHIPSSEPRVLASLSPALPFTSTASIPPYHLIQLTYTLENPTQHFLTFALTMEASETFAFSGPKARTLNIVPMSRRSVTYRLLPLVDGWMNPCLVVEDMYFKKVLKVAVTSSEGGKLRLEKKGIGVLVESGKSDVMDG